MEAVDVSLITDNESILAVCCKVKHADFFLDFSELNIDVILVIALAFPVTVICKSKSVFNILLILYSPASVFQVV